MKLQHTNLQNQEKQQQVEKTLWKLKIGKYSKFKNALT